MKEDRKKAAEKVKKLLAVTLEANASEEEVITATKAAHKLIEDYQLHMTDVELEAEGVDRLTVDMRSVSGKTLNFKYGTRDKIAQSIAAYCECKVWKEVSLKVLVYFGLKSDVEFATWLSDSLTMFITNEADRYMLTETRTARPRWHYRVAFINGAAVRINERLDEMTKAREEAKRPKLASGQALVVVKNAIVDRELEKLRLELRKTVTGQRIGLERKAFTQGEVAGDRASFGRPVNQGEPVRRITGN